MNPTTGPVAGSHGASAAGVGVDRRVDDLGVERRQRAGHGARRRQHDVRRAPHAGHAFHDVVDAEDGPRRQAAQGRQQAPADRPVEQHDVGVAGQPARPRPRAHGGRPGAPVEAAEVERLGDVPGRSGGVEEPPRPGDGERHAPTPRVQRAEQAKQRRLGPTRLGHGGHSQKATTVHGGDDTREACSSAAEAAEVGLATALA